MGWDVGSCSGPRTDELRSMFSDLEGCWAALSAIMREGPKKLQDAQTGANSDNGGRSPDRCGPAEPSGAVRGPRGRPYGPPDGPDGLGGARSNPR